MKSDENVDNGMASGGLGHLRSLEIVPFDREHTSSY